MKESKGIYTSDGKMIFARVGGLKAVKQKGYDSTMPTFHCPPARKGIYSFLWPYIETFLLTGNADGQSRNACVTTEYEDEHGEERYRCPRLTQLKRDGLKKYTYEGEIWCHFVDLAKELHCDIEVKGSWVKVHTDDLIRILKKDFHETKGSFLADGKSIVNNKYFVGTVTNPYKDGQSYCSTTRDHLEVFIEKPKPGKVR